MPKYYEQFYYFFHVRREANQAAHYFAKYAIFIFLLLFGLNKHLFVFDALVAFDLMSTPDV